MTGALLHRPVGEHAHWTPPCVRWSGMRTRCCCRPRFRFAPDDLHLAEPTCNSWCN
jgi:hypothetical protein